MHAGPGGSVAVVTSASARSPREVVEPSAVVRGAVMAVVICLPLALVSQAVDGDDGSGIRTGLFFGVLAGLAAGGAVAARAAAAVPYTNGGLAALRAFVAIPGTALVVRLVTDGDTPSLPSLVFVALLAYGCGVAGSVLGTRRRATGTGRERGTGT